MREQLALLPGYLAAHLGLTLVALLLGVLLSVPAGIVVARHRRLEPPVLGAASVIQTIPSLALLAFMVPALAALGARSIGYLPALIGLFLYSVLPILRNTITGLAGLDPAVIEAARGVGMTANESLLRVELPLALPVIIAGVRISAVWTVGTATLSTPVGAPSLGNYIFSGLQTRNYTAVLVGCVASAALAMVIDTLVRAIAYGLAPDGDGGGGDNLRRRRRGLSLGLLGFGLLACYAAAPLVGGLGSRRPPAVVIGAKTFTESYILAHILAGRVERTTGLPTRTMDSLGSTVAFDALESGQIDAYVDYAGTLWATILKRAQPPADRATAIAEIDRALRRDHGITVVGALGFENAYALVMRRADADRLAVRRLTDLAPRSPRLRMGGDYELFQRPEWKALVAAYGFSFSELRSMDPSLMYEAARAGNVDVIGAFSTDGRIAAYDLVVLEDDRRAIPPYDALVLASARLTRERPQVLEALRGLVGRIDDATMRRLNLDVDQQQRSPATVAAGFLDRL